MVSKNVLETEAEDRADDARLAKKLKICNGCSTPEAAGQHPALMRRQNNQMEADIGNGPGANPRSGPLVLPLRGSEEGSGE